jgi:hypothetical protein
MMMLVLSSGQLEVESGSPTELMARPGGVFAASASAARKPV